MRVLLTGHRGYVGTVLTTMLVDAGHDVVGCDIDLFERATYPSGQREVAIPAIERDVRDITPGDLEGFDAVLHLAGLSNDPLGDLDPALTAQINHLASVELARSSKAAGVERFVFSSSCSNYGAGGKDMLDEGSDFNPVTPYGHSKADTERDVAPMADDNFSPTFLRSSTAYGVSPRLRFDLVLNNLTAWAYTTGEVFMKSDGTPWRPIVHIEDMAAAFVATLDAPREAIHNEAFNVGSTAENYRISELAELVAATVPDSRVEYAEGAGPDTRTYRVNCDKIADVLPTYKPTWTAQKGIDELLASYQAVGIDPADFEGPRYKRIDHLKMLLADGVIAGDLRRIS
ncbi:MAG: SDR family oxidoreductase [Actinomycetota bacterium]